MGGITVGGETRVRKCDEVAARKGPVALAQMPPAVGERAFPMCRVQASISRCPRWRLERDLASRNANAMRSVAVSMRSARMSLSTA